MVFISLLLNLCVISLSQSTMLNMHQSVTLLCAFPTVQSGWLGLAALNVLCLEPICLLFSLFCSAAPPQMIEKPQDMQKTIDDSLVWECMAIGKPKPSYRWMKNGENLEPTEVCHVSELFFFINNLIKAY